MRGHARRSTSRCRRRSPRGPARRCGWLELPEGTVLALEKPFGTDWPRPGAQRAGAHAGARGPGLPGRPLPRAKSTCSTCSGVRFANRLLRAAVEQRARRARRDRLRRDARPGGPGRLLRPGRRAGRHDPEPPAAGDGAARDGARSAAVDERELRDAKAEVLRATPAAGRRPGTASRRARYTAGTIGGRQLPAYSRRARGRRGPPHRDPGRADRRGRHLALGRRAVHGCAPARRSGGRARRSWSRSSAPPHLPTGLRRPRHPRRG